MKIAKKLLEDLAVFNGEPNVVPPDDSNEQSDNYFLVNVFNNFLHTADVNLDCVGVEVSEGEVNAFITDGEKVVSLNFFDQDGIPFMSVSDPNDESEPENDEEEVDAYDLSDLGIWDGTNFNFTKLDASILDIFADEVGSQGEEPLAEAFLTVIRKGKRVKKMLKRKKRKKPLTGKRKMGVRRAVMKRKRTQRQALRKRRKSLAIRDRAHLKHKPKNYKVV